MRYPGYFHRNGETGAVMEKIRRLFYGYLTVLVQGKQLERFLNLCRNRGIFPEKISHPEEEKILMQMSAGDFFLLRPIRNKTGVHIQIMKKRGMPFFFFRNKKRKAFFGGVLVGAILLFLLSGRIWNIHIDGNRINSTPEILDFLEEEGIVHGMAKRKVDCAKIASSVRKKFTETTWVSARIEGTRLILEIKEGLARDEMQEDILENSQPCSLVAEQEGVIAEMIVRAGVPLKKPGDTCQKGEVLVSGELHIMNDEQEVARCEYVHADADIWITRTLSYYQEFPLRYQVQEKTGVTKQRFFFRFGSWYAQISEKSDPKWRCLTQEVPLRITENFKIPVSFGRIWLMQYRLVSGVYTETQAKELAAQKLQQYEKELMEKGIDITENKISVKITKTMCVSKGTISIKEKIGKETKIRAEMDADENLYLKSDGEMVQ